MRETIEDIERRPNVSGKIDAISADGNIVLDLKTPQRKIFTAAVERGTRYAIAQLEFDAKSGPVTLSDGTEIPVRITSADLSAAAEWLRYVLSRKA